MNSLLARRRGPFAVALVAVVVVCILVIALPASLFEQVGRNRPLTDAQAGWAYRLIALVALVQAGYGGFAVFRIDRVDAIRARDPNFATKPHTEVIASLARTAAAMVLLTLVYGLATMAITGLRGGFWLFPLIAVAQAAWYYREIGQIAHWAAFQPPAAIQDADRGAWGGRWPGHVPALARGMTVVNETIEDDAGDR